MVGFRLPGQCPHILTLVNFLVFSTLFWINSFHFLCAPLIQCKASKESYQQIILRMVNDARKYSKTISTDPANKRHDHILRRGIDTGWIGATLVFDKTNIVDSPLDK